MSCWSEYSHKEIMSMYGVEPEDKNEIDDENFEPETYEEEEQDEPLTLESLGMSWRDFY